MSFPNIIGSFGVALLLLAFFLSLFKFMTHENRVYIALNIIGAGLSCYASVLIHYLPFILLEAVWCLVALFAFVKNTSRL